MPKVTQQVSNSFHTTLPTPPPWMPLSEPLPTPMDELSHRAQAAWAYRGATIGPRGPTPDEFCSRPEAAASQQTPAGDAAAPAPSWTGSNPRNSTPGLSPLWFPVCSLLVSCAQGA